MASLFIYFSAGLTLEINIEQLDYVSVLSQEAGIRVFIGGQREMPFPYEQGISVSPGFSTAIELRKVKTKQTLTSHKRAQSLEERKPFGPFLRHFHLSSGKKKNPQHHSKRVGDVDRSDLVARRDLNIGIHT